MTYNYFYSSAICPTTTVGCFSPISGSRKNCSTPPLGLPPALSVIGGDTNLIGSLAPGEPHADHSFIGNGCNPPHASGPSLNNQAAGLMSFIGNGMVNCAMGDYSFIGNGTGNAVVAGNSHSAIGGGAGNRISAACGTIGGGQNNFIMPGATHSGIFSGCNNIVSGQCSVIFGGSGNNDNGLPYVGIFGCNINNPLNMSANTFHAECLNAINTPNGGAFLPPGSIYYLPASTPPPIGSKILYIV